MVYVVNTCVNEEIIWAGMALVFDYYCKDSVCSGWKQLEKQAQQARIGLWSQPDPLPPWDYRRGHMKPSELKALTAAPYHGNKRSKVLHQSSCKDFNCKNCIIGFKTRELQSRLASPAVWRM